MTNDDEHGDEENKKILPAPLKLASRKGWRTDGRTDSWARTEAARGTPPPSPPSPPAGGERSPRARRSTPSRARAQPPPRENSLFLFSYWTRRGASRLRHGELTAQGAIVAAGAARSAKCANPGPRWPACGLNANER